MLLPAFFSFGAFQQEGPTETLPVARENGRPGSHFKPDFATGDAQSNPSSAVLSNFDVTTSRQPAALDSDRACSTINSW